MKVIRILLIIGVLLFLGLPQAGFAEDRSSAQGIIAKSRLAFFYAGNDMKVKILMELIHKDGQKRVRELTMLRKDYEEGGNQKYFIYFHKPSDVKDTTFMVYKYPDKDDERWIFIPAINMVKRIAASDKYSSFVGSDFTYEDVSGRKPEEDEHLFLKEGEIGARRCYTIESTPRGPSEYAKKVSWIDKENLLPLKEEFYDKHGEVSRVFEAQEVKDINGTSTVTKRVMRNIKSGHRTEVRFESVEYNLGIQDDVFQERYLRRPPAEWIR